MSKEAVLRRFPRWKLCLSCAVLAVSTVACSRGGVLVRDPDAPPEAKIIPVTDNTSADPDVATLQRRIRDLEHRLAARGTGAYAQGPTVSLTGQRREGLLDKLHALEKSLTDTQKSLATQSEELGRARLSLQSTTESAQKMRDQVEILTRAQESLEVAQQALAANKNQLHGATERLTASELSRLRVEKAYFDLAAELISLRVEETARFRDLQTRVRDEVSRQRPEDLPRTGKQP